MSGDRRRQERVILEIEEIRRALGAVASAEPAVFWIYRGRDHLWRARREGAEAEHRFASRAAARAFIELQAARCRSFRLFIQDDDGGFAAESSSWPAPVRRLISSDERTSIDPDQDCRSGLGRRRPAELGRFLQRG